MLFNLATELTRGAPGPQTPPLILNTLLFVLFREAAGQYSNLLVAQTTP